jgi:hypothetical protein
LINSRHSHDFLINFAVHFFFLFILLLLFLLLINTIRESFSSSSCYGSNSLAAEFRLLIGHSGRSCSIQFDSLILSREKLSEKKCSREGKMLREKHFRGKLGWKRLKSTVICACNAVVFVLMNLCLTPGQCQTLFLLTLTHSRKTSTHSKNQIKTDSIAHDKNKAPSNVSLSTSQSKDSMKTE